MLVILRSRHHSALQKKLNCIIMKHHICDHVNSTTNAKFMEIFLDWVCALLILIKLLSLRIMINIINERSMQLGDSISRPDARLTE